MVRRKEGRVGDAVSTLKEGVGEGDCGSMLVTLHCTAPTSTNPQRYLTPGRVDVS
jgi:hypothetical protein